MERCKDCYFFRKLEKDFKVGKGYTESCCCIYLSKNYDGQVIELVDDGNMVACECFRRRGVK